MLVLDTDISVILLAGGKGTRMGGKLPKQFLPIHDKPVALYSFEVFLKMPQVSEIIVVAPERHWPLFQSDKKKIEYAHPGLRRQDSSYHGFLKASNKASLICIHDAARPCVKIPLMEDLFKAANIYGASAPGSLSTCTLKEANSENLIVRTIDRSRVWMIQTPQVIRRDWLAKGFEKALKEQLRVTDDLQLIEPLGYSAKIIENSDENLKLTYPGDLELVSSLLEGEVSRG